ncbi:MAG: LytTR family transcriptional regulator DNA-binding domain-containing protein [Sphingobacteriales bacterium]|nr:LytTR family transcriptional regulator DNA-binding domain-containing protein [Sphingobacteriales bacterium]
MYVISLLNKPFPLNSWRWYKWRGIGFGLFVFLFLFLFKPFRLDLYPSFRLFYTAAMYGFVTGAVILVGGSFFIKIIAPYINEEKWTLGKQILLNIVLMTGITIFNILVTQLVHQITLPLWWHFNMLKWVLMLGALPVAIAELISYNYYLRQHVKSAEGLSKNILVTFEKAVSQPELSDQLINNIPFRRDITAAFAEKEIKAVYKKKPSLLILTGENQNDRLEIPHKRLLAVQALDNYVNVFWEQDNKLQSTMLRNTLTNISEQLVGISCMYRCHRGWLVNTQRVVQVEGNAQGLKLSVDFLPQPVPVSRANIAGYRQVAEQHLADLC